MQLRRRPARPPCPPAAPPSQPGSQSVRNSQSVSQPASQSVGQSVGRSVSKSVSRSVSEFALRARPPCQPAAPPNRTHLGEAEVEEPHGAGRGEAHVGGLDVAVNNDVPRQRLRVQKAHLQVRHSGGGGSSGSGNGGGARVAPGVERLGEARSCWGHARGDGSGRGWQFFLSSFLGRNGK